MHNRAVFFAAALAFAAGCAGSSDGPSDGPSGGAESALTQREADGSMTFSVDGDANVEVWALSSRYGFKLLLRRGAASHWFDCALGRNANGIGAQALACGPLTLSRAPGDRYSLAVGDAYDDATNAEPMDPADPVLFVARREQKHLTVTRAGQATPFVIADRVDDALGRLVGLSYGGSVIHRIVAWKELGLRIQPQFELGSAQPYATSKDCYSSARPSMLVDVANPEKGFASAAEIAQRYAQTLAREDDPHALCQ